MTPGREVRAVLYARCSTEEESQKNALLQQVEEGKECIKMHGWRLIRSYVESKSGTTVKGRTQFQQLYEDLERDDFEIIVIKSQDRLMRNTKDWYMFLDRMQTYGKRLYIYLENRFYTPDDSLITGIKAILAEEYSRELSKKINNAHHHRQEKGEIIVITNQTLGFRKTQDKGVEIYEPEAAAIRRMAALSASGYGSRRISKILYNEGYRRKNGAVISETAVRRAIRNPLYKGTAVMNKTHFDFATKKVEKNPEKEWMFHEHAVPAIIDEQLWDAANRQMDLRMEKGGESSKYTRGMNSGKHDLNGKLICGLCRKPYYRTFRRRYRDKAQIVEWKCSTYLYNGRKDPAYTRSQITKAESKEKEGCDNIHLEEQKLYELLEQIFQEWYQVDYPEVVRKVLGLLKRIFRESDYSRSIKSVTVRLIEIKKQMDILLDKLLDGIIPDGVYKRKQEVLEQEKERLQIQLSRYEKEAADNQRVEERIRNIETALMQDHMQQRVTVAQMMDEIDKIEVYPEYIFIHFNRLQMVGLKPDDVWDSNNGQYALKVAIGNMFNTRGQRECEKLRMLNLIQENPHMTAKQMASELNISQRAVVYRLNALKKEERIRFHGRGGHGCWVVLEK